MKHKEQQCLLKTIKNGKQMFTTECVGLVLAGLAASGAASGQGPRRLPRAPAGRSAGACAMQLMRFHSSIASGFMERCRQASEPHSCRAPVFMLGCDSSSDTSAASCMNTACNQALRCASAEQHSSCWTHGAIGVSIQQMTLNRKALLPGIEAQQLPCAYPC